ncbi:MAG: UDP-N-acetylmuramate dehydrogenase [Clostridiales bacterium]|nr:UDP-N-acetylmuramate dehydrogenase [Clostridiales bacterium]
MIDKLAEALGRAMPALTLLRNEPMSRHTTFQVGGPADLLALPADAAQAVRAMEMAADLGVPAMVMGRGSNLLVRDGGIRGLVVKLGEGFSAVRAEGDRLIAQGGAALTDVCRAAQRAGLSGIEFACGIPGTVGGAVAMNAGAYGGEMACALCGATVAMDGCFGYLTAEGMECGYRTTRVLRRGGIVLEAEFQLTPDDPAEILRRMEEFDRRRREKQPLHMPSAGSVFKRPEGHFAGALIDQAGLRGARLGGAQVSEMHAGFIVNAGGATAADVLALIARVQREVLAHSGVALEMEVRVVGED